MTSQRIDLEFVVGVVIVSVSLCRSLSRGSPVSRCQFCSSASLFAEWLG